MKAKTLKLKYPKNPGVLLDKPEVVDYIWHLEDVGELDKLPLPFLAYYVVGCRLTDEVNNGGFAQYLSNSSVQTLPYLERCVNAFGNAELTAICSELLSAVSKDFDINDTEAIAEADYSDELEKCLSALDDRFYTLDEKCNVEELAKKYYKDNIPEEKLIFELVKPPVTDRRRYFTYDKSSITNEEAAKAFMAFLAEFSDVKFDISIEKKGGMFRINATDSTNSLDLAEIHAHFDDSSYAFGKNSGSERCRILGFKLGGGIFKEIHVDSCDDENWVWRLTISESGFDKNEYEISYFRFCSGSSNPNRQVSRICVGDFADDPEVIAVIEKVFVECAKSQGNITRIYEEMNGWDVDPEDEIKIIFGS